MVFQKQKIPTNTSEFLVFDLGTSRITVAYCVIEDGYAHMKDFMTKQYANDVFRFGDIAKSRVLHQSIKSLVRDFSDRIGELPDTSYLILNHPSFLTDTMSYSFIREKREDLIVRDEIYDYLVHIESLSLDKLQSQWDIRTSHSLSDMYPVYARISSMYIDGNHTTYPIDLTGKNIQFNVLNAVGSNVFLSQVTQLFSRSNIRISEVIPVGSCLLQYMDLDSESSQVIIDFGYTYTTICVYDGRMHLNFSVLPVGYRAFEDLLLSSTQLTPLEIQDILYNPSRHSEYKREFDIYQKMLMCALQVGFEDLNLSISSSCVYFSGSDAFKSLYSTITDGSLSPWISKGSELVSLSDISPDKVITTDRKSLMNIIGFLQGNLESHSIDPFANMIRDIVSHYE